MQIQKTSYMEALATNENNKAFTLRMIHNHVEHALMRVYAQRKINIKYHNGINFNDKYLQDGIEQALNLAPITAIEKIWAMGSKFLDNVICEVLIQLHIPKIQHHDAANDRFYISDSTKFSKAIVKALQRRAELSSTIRDIQS